MSLTVGELRKMLADLPGELPVVAMPKGSRERSDRIGVTGAWCMQGPEDARVSAFALVLAMTVPGPVERVEIVGRIW